MEEQTLNHTSTGQPATSEQASMDNGATTQPELPADALQQRVQQLEQESASFKDQYLRATAEMRNFRRRVEQERADQIRNAGAGVLMKLLPILDDFDLAMAHVPAEIAESAWFNGIKLVQSKLQTMLEGEGVRPIQALGQTFDPNFHEAVMHEPAGAEYAGKVTAELRRGYLLHDRVLRPTMVKVGEG
jgi:molecular chaperone GrpE